MTAFHPIAFGDRLSVAVIVTVTFPIPFEDRSRIPFAVIVAALPAIPFAVEAFLPMIQLAVLVAVFHTLHAVDSTPVVIDCVWVVTRLSSVLEEWRLGKAAVVP